MSCRAEPVADQASSAPRAAARAPAASATAASTTEAGAWRSVDPRRLDHVVLWVSHLLVRHRDAEQADVPFSLAEWSSQPPPPDRSREEALALATSLRARAERGELDLATLASRHSEDETTRARGGSLGGLSASSLLPWPEVLDALGRTRPGRVSAVVETRYGFHLFQRQEPPASELIAGTRLVIGHDRARWLRFNARRPPAQRSHADALALARELRARALEAPGSFVDLVRRHSEHRDAERDGDLGEWSSREPTPFPRELAALRQLQVGQISEPLDTVLGVQLLLRTPATSRPEYAMAAIRVPFDETRADGELLSRARQRSDAQSLLEQLLREPFHFEEAQANVTGAANGERWRAGRLAIGLEPLLDRLQPGRIAPELIEIDGSWAIVKRLDPASVARPEVSFELPGAEAQHGG